MPLYYIERFMSDLCILIQHPQTESISINIK